MCIGLVGFEISNKIIELGSNKHILIKETVIVKTDKLDIQRNINIINRNILF